MRAMSADGLAAAQAKMRQADAHPTAINVFSHYYRQLETGATGVLPESDLRPLKDPPRLADLEHEEAAGRAALDATVVIKLNGGLGTSMGMDRAKSLLEVRDGRQVAGAQLRLPVLQEVEADAVDGEVGVRRQGGERVITGPKRVHEDQRQPHRR